MRKEEVCREIGVKVILVPEVPGALIKGRKAPPLLPEEIDWESKTMSAALIAISNADKEGREMETKVGRLLMNAIAPKLGELNGKGDIVLTLTAKREE